MIKSIEGYSYNVNEWIGKGYSSTVHKGKKESTGQDVSLKVIEMAKLQDPINEMLLQYQISALKSLTFSPNVLHLENVYATKNNTYIITQLMQGDLHNLLKQKKQFPYYEAVEVIKQIIKGYYDVYKNGYLHRDIKPANIFYKNGIYKIGDFGFAIPTTDAHNHRHYNVGSPMYMPPQALKQNIYSTSCDTWAIGIIFYQLLKGLAPWRAVSEQKLYEKILNEPLSEFTFGLPEVARVFLSRVLSLEPNNRLSPQELLSWPGKLFSVQIRGQPQIKMNVQKIPLQQISANNLNLQSLNSFFSRSKSYSSNQVPNYVSGLRINMNNCQINTYQTQKVQIQNQKSAVVIPSITNRNSLNQINYESNKQIINNWQKTSAFLAPSDFISTQQKQQNKISQSKNVEFYALNMISYVKFLHKVVKFIGNPTEIHLKDLEMSLTRYLFKELEFIRGLLESQNLGLFNQVPEWKELIKSSQFHHKFKEPLNLMSKKYHMFLTLPQDQFILEVYRQQIIDGIKKIFSYFQKGNYSDKALISLEYLVSFYKVWDYREKKGNSFNLREFLQVFRFDQIMSRSPYDVKRQNVIQVKQKINQLGILNEKTMIRQVPTGFNMIQSKKREIIFNNKENYPKLQMRY